MKCPHCEYKWQSKVKEPKSCPRCKKRLDTPFAKEKIAVYKMESEKWG